MRESPRLSVRGILIVGFFALVLQHCGNPSGPEMATPPVLATGPVVGLTAPAFVVKSIDGRTIDLPQLRGKVVLLAFFGKGG